MKKVEEEKETENEEEMKAGKRKAGQESVKLGREGGRECRKAGEQVRRSR